MIDDPALLKNFGITRLGDVTDLDTIGMPVWFAARPNSRGLSVSQGKGMTVEQAKLSAVMEAIEGSVAEDTRRHISDHGSISDISRRSRNTVPLEAMSRVEPSLLDPDRQRAWVKGHSVKDGADVLAPFELIGLDFRADFPWDRQAFSMSSQGLAAGFDFDHAALHAILELVENEASAFSDTFVARMSAKRPVRFAEGQSPDLDALVDRLNALDLAPTFTDLTTTNEIPVILATIPRTMMTQDGPGQRVAAGVACRLSPADAACSALQEAIQSRLTYISGARDDLLPQHYRADQSLSSAAVPACPVRADWRGPILGKNMPGSSTWKAVADHLLSCGAGDLFLFRLETGNPDVVVVRALASGMAIAGSSHTRLNLTALSGLLGP